MKRGKMMEPNTSRAGGARSGRWLATALAAGLVLAACANDDGAEPTDDTAPAATAEPEPTDTEAPDTTDAEPTDAEPTDTEPTETTPPAPDFEPTTLTMWTPITDQVGMEAFQPLLQRCEAENPWLTIDFVGKDDIGLALSAAIEAGEPPDLVQADLTGQLASIQAAELAVSVSDLAERDGLDWDAFVPAGVKLLEFNGERYGLPFSLDTVALFYNQDVLDEIGVDGPPDTFDELLTDAEKLLVVADDGTIERVGFVPDVGDGSYAVYFGDMFGATLFSDDGAAITIGETIDQWIEAAQWQKQFYELMDPDEFDRWADALGSYDSADNFFINGQLPLYFESSFFVTWPDRFGEGRPEEWGVVPMPVPGGVDEENPASLVPSGNWFMIPNGVDDVEKSWAALKCLAFASEEIATFQEAFGNIPSNIEALDLFEEVTVAELPEFETFIDLARSSNASVPGSSLVSGALIDEMTALLLDHRRGDSSDDQLRDELLALNDRYQDELDLELGN